MLSLYFPSLKTQAYSRRFKPTSIQAIFENATSKSSLLRLIEIITPIWKFRILDWLNIQRNNVARMSFIFIYILVSDAKIFFNNLILESICTIKQVHIGVCFILHYFINFSILVCLTVCNTRHSLCDNWVG